jgi:hypothetical protein
MINAKTYFKVSAANFAFLVAGAVLSPAIVRSLDYIGVAHAQSAKVEPKPSVQDGNYEYISPSISANAGAFETLLAHRVATDQLMVNGYDILKLQNALLSALLTTGRISQEQARDIAESSKVKPLRLQPAPQR